MIRQSDHSLRESFHRFSHGYWFDDPVVVGIACVEAPVNVKGGVAVLYERLGRSRALPRCPICGSAVAVGLRIPAKCRIDGSVRLSTHFGRRMCATRLAFDFFGLLPLVAFVLDDSAFRNDAQ
jgi:hypothetical protein